MDGTDGHPQRSQVDDRGTSRDRIADEFARIMGHSDEPRTEIDVATYLLHPPRSPESVERRVRRQRIVGVASLVACVVLAVALVAPWPGSSDAPAVQPPAAPPATAEASRTQAAAPDPLPRRVDAPGVRTTAKRVDVAVPRRRVTPRATARPAATEPATRGPTSARVSSAPSVRRPPARPSNASASAPAPLMPLS